MLKVDIKAWSSEKFRDIEKKIAEIGARFDALDRCQKNRDLSVEECRQMKEAKARMWQLKKVKDMYNFQKSRV